MIYTIYHIPGKKIGCTRQKIEARAKQNKAIEYEILETYTDIDVTVQKENRIIHEQHNRKRNTK